jgi:hypothetical protein
LDRVGRALPTTFGVRTGAIADDDLDAWVMTQPVGQGVSGAIVEQIDWSVCLEVDQQCAVAALLPSQRDVVNTQYPRPTLIVGIRDRMQEPQECVRADWQTHFARQARATFAAGLQRKRRQQIRRAVSTARIPSQRAVETFGKDLPRTRGRIAEPSSAVYPHPYGLPAPRQVEWVALVATVLSSTQLTAFRTRDGHPRGFDNEDQAAITLDDNQDDAPAFGLCPKRHGHRDSPRQPR